MRSWCRTSAYATSHHKSGIEGSAEAMKEVRSAVVASSLVLLAVFVPVAFFPGTTGQVYKQFALTIAASITISLFTALTLAPSLSALLLKDFPESTRGFFGWFNRRFHAFKDSYSARLPGMFKRRWLVLAVFGFALLLTAYLFKSTPTGFIPTEDQGYFITLVQAPQGTRSRANARSPSKPRRSCWRNRASSTSSISEASASRARLRTAA